jgi:dTMP kinase
MTARDPKARIIALVGIDGAGKTTQAHLLAEWLSAHGHPANYCQNAGGRRWFGQLARRLGLRDAQNLLGTGGMLFIETVLRWLAILRALVRSRLRRRIAVMDRYSWCQYASVRAHSRSRGTRRERRARRMFRLFPEPDLTCFLAVRPGRAYSRIELRGTDHEDLDYLSAADAAYRSLPEAERFVIVDADQDPVTVQRALRIAVAARIPGLDVDVAAPVAEKLNPSAQAPILEK